LVYQQTAVLKCNLDYAIASRCGDMNANDSIERAAWDKRLAENMVVVCTPEILNQCLRHSLVTMDRINLLVFDEAHHAKKNHPYAKIIGDFYKIRPETAPTETRPRVFGMTASPIDAKVDLIAASRELESLLDCKIATYPLAEEYRNQAEEVTLKYQRLREPFKTRLHTLVEEQVGHIPAFERYFETSKYLSSQLGAWAAERYWHHAFRTEDLARLLGKLSKAFGKWKMDVASSDAQEAQVRRAFQIVEDYIFRRPKANLDDLSTKVEELHRFLTEHYDKDLKNRCIIFVEQKATARMLVEVFNEIGAKNLRPGLLTGHAAKEGDARVSFRQQVLTMTAFRKGTINCLFATSVAEEGLDVPDCNLVIRFDLYKTVIQYVQSKGRARHKNSKFVELCEEKNQRETSVRNEARLQEMKLKHWIGNLDPSRRIEGDEGLVKNEPLGRRYVHHMSKATLTYHNALGVLSLFASTVVCQQQHYSIGLKTLTSSYSPLKTSTPPPNRNTSSETTTPANSNAKSSCRPTHPFAQYSGSATLAKHSRNALRPLRCASSSCSASSWTAAC
jgi:endoribonuclease Dicer